ncbi:hypothetical protein G647_06338 [Cladophialophora carrionii CBS 160.54]|uniref:Fungal N-terminal domain-containing protein n=1 Tax=Cladophialophora carrionii CBS 160.54 TaxID=1279043 RepID=V9D5V9_9EURO|nr:uncharacterized protein G647_06338 [Cladophialophora carrionii CBS 160.54]ETI22265.1 hypothetical protein G647_06338 [Cladophialophora carrionii CBS 160.54]
MVLEAIGAFALACNILQVVEYGAKVVAKAGSLHRPSRESTTAITDLDAITQQLNNLNNDLGSSAVPAPSQACPLYARLAECNAESLRLSQNFIDFVQKLRPKTTASQGNPSWAASFRFAIRLRWHQEEVQALQNSVSHARSNLIVAFLFYMHSTQASSSSQTALLAASNQFEQDMRLAIDDTSNKLHCDIVAVLQQMTHLKLQDSAYETHFAQFQASHADALLRLSVGIESIMLEQEAIRTTSDKQRAQVA